MPASTAREPRRGLTFEDVWAALMELREYQEETNCQLRESREETDRQLRESREETDRRIRESREEAERRIRESDEKLRRTIDRTSRIVGDLGNKFGELSEYLVVPNLVEKFNKLEFTFTKAGRNVEFRGPDNKILTEADVLLENGEFVMIVEVKSDLSETHIRHHIERMKKLRRYADAHNDKRKFMGAVAGAIMHDKIKAAAYEAGFFVIEQSGDTVKIEKPEGFTPKIW
jgi:hypothetical protein